MVAASPLTYRYVGRFDMSDQRRRTAVLGERMGTQSNLTGTSWDVLSRRPFWSSFEHSQVPMCLVARDRRVVASTDAACELFGTSREAAVGSDAGRQITDDDPVLGDKLWLQLLSANELYAETVEMHP